MGVDANTDEIRGLERAFWSSCVKNSDELVEGLSRGGSYDQAYLPTCLEAPCCVTASGAGRSPELNSAFFQRFLEAKQPLKSGKRAFACHILESFKSVLD